MGRRWVPWLLLGGLMLTACTKPTKAPNIAEKAGPPGHRAEPDPNPKPVLKPAPEPEHPHVNVHGLYMTGWTAGSDRFYELVRYMKQSGLNAVVIDVMDDDGHISWQSDIPLAREIGANLDKIPDIAARIQFLKAEQIYVIARIVVYADPLLGKKRPEMAILGGTFVDARGIRWPDPYNQQVWEYKVAVAKEAAAMGFDEIQFDYIRFPEHRIEGYNYKVPVERRTDAVAGFLRYASSALKPLGVYIAADVFGLTTSVAEGDDMEIGQDYAVMANIVDYILPMVYPSHYAPGTYAVADPNRAPGSIVYESLVAAQKRTIDLPTQKHRPWIQDFTYGKTYTADDVEEQIRGLARSGIYQWILWDPYNRYTRSVDYNAGGGLSGPQGAWREAFASKIRQHRVDQARAKRSRLFN